MNEVNKNMRSGVRLPHIFSNDAARTKNKGNVMTCIAFFTIGLSAAASHAAIRPRPWAATASSILC